MAKHISQLNIVNAINRDREVKMRKKNTQRSFFRLLHPKGILSISEQIGDVDKISVDEIKDLLIGKF